MSKSRSIFCLIYVQHTETEAYVVLWYGAEYNGTMFFFRNVGTDYSVAQCFIQEEWKHQPHLRKNLKTRTMKLL